MISGKNIPIYYIIALCKESDGQQFPQYLQNNQLRLSPNYLTRKDDDIIMYMDI